MQKFSVFCFCLLFSISNLKSQTFHLDVQGDARVTGRLELGDPIMENLFIGINTGINITTGNENTFIGFQSGINNTTGGNNTFLGYETGFNTTTGGGNVFISGRAGYNNTTGSCNFFVGNHSGYNTTIGYENIGIGCNTLQQNITGYQNTAIGGGSFEANTTGSRNTAIGIQSMGGGETSTTGGDNTVVGAYAGFNITSGYNNSFFGSQAGENNTSGSENVAIGSAALYSNTTESGLVAVGDSSLYNNSLGSRNTAIGEKSLYKNTTGFNNTAVGSRVMQHTTTSFDNTALGANALHYNKHGSFNVAIGKDALIDNIGGYWNTSIGTSSSRRVRGSFNTAVGGWALYEADPNDGLTAVGYEAMRYAYRGEHSGVNPEGYGRYNAAFGYQALKGSTNQINNTGSGNTAIGYESMTNNTSGEHNIGLGYSTLSNNTIGNNNVALGSGSLTSNTEGVNNVAVGYGAGRDNTTGAANSFVGHNSGALSTTSIGNTLLGYATGQNLKDGQRNIYIGEFAEGSDSSAYNQIVIGSYAKGKGNNTAVVGDSMLTDVYMAQSAKALVHAGNAKLYDIIENNSADSILVYQGDSTLAFRSISTMNTSGWEMREDTVSTSKFTQINNSLTIKGNSSSVNTVACSNSYSMDLRGGSDYISIDPGFTFSGLSGVTFSIWAKVPSFPSVCCNAIFDISDGVSDNTWANRYSLSARTTFQFGNEGSSAVGWNVTFPTSGYENQWVYLVAVADAAKDTAYLYLDGLLVSKGAFHKDASTLNLSAGNSTSKILGQRSSTLNRDYDGYVDEFSVWNYALTASEVESLYTGCIEGNESGLIGYWDFNEGTGTIATDKSSNSNNATLVSSPSWSTDLPWEEVLSESKKNLSIEDGDLSIESSDFGMIMTSPNGKKWRVKVDDSGSLTVQEVLP